MNCEAYERVLPGKTCESFEAGFTMVKPGQCLRREFC